MSDQQLPTVVRDATVTPKLSKFRQICMTRWKIWSDARFLLFCLCIAGIVQGMIFTNVVISSIERRFGYDSTQSGIIAGSYDLGALLAVIPVTYFGGKPGASKPRVIAIGMAVIAAGSLVFSLPQFMTNRYVDLIMLTNTDDNTTSARDSTMASRVCRLESKSNQDASTIEMCDVTTDDKMASHTSDLNSYKYVFILGQLLHGTGASAITTLGTTLLDESVTKRLAPLYIGIFETSFVLGPALGYVVGGKLLNIFIEFYSTDRASLEIMSTLTPASPQWVGAWWLGFLMIVALSVVCAIVMWMFPDKISPEDDQEPVGTKSLDKSKDDQIISNVTNNNNDEFRVSRCDYGRLQDMPKAIYSLLTNATYMCIGVGAALDAFLLAGMAAFLPKYLEYQYGMTSGQAAMLVGVIIVPAGAGGTLLGGFILKHFEMGRKRCLQFYIICQVIIFPTYLGFMFNCPTLPYGGVDGFSSGQNLQLQASCNQECQCNVNAAVTDPSAVTSLYYEPVCHLTSGTTFFSACLAGCTDKSTVAVGNKTVFHNCLCLPEQSQNITDNYVIPGTCPSECSHIPFSILLFFNLLFTFVGTMPGLVASLRSVEYVQRSLSLGLQTILLRGIGTVPGPIIFGYIIDRTCLLWQATVGHQACDVAGSAEVAKGSCRLYDNVPMSYNVMAVLFSWRFVGTLFFVLALYFSNRSKIKDEDQVRPADVKNEEGK